MKFYCLTQSKIVKFNELIIMILVVFLKLNNNLDMYSWVHIIVEENSEFFRERIR